MKRTWLILLRILVSLTITVAAAYVSFSVYLNNRFLYGSRVNGVDVSMMTAKEAAKALEAAAAEYELFVADSFGITETLRGSDLGLGNPDLNRLGVLISRQSPLLWPEGFFRTFSYEDAGVLSMDEERAMEAVKGLRMIRESRGEPSTDAYIEYDDAQGRFVIIPETYGDMVSPAALLSDVEYYACSLQPRLDSRKTDCYDKPAVTSADQEINDSLIALNSYTDSVVRYEIDEAEETVDCSVYHDWLYLSEGRARLDMSKVSSFVDEMAEKYDTYSDTREIITSWGDVVTLESDEPFGWEIDRSAETEALAGDILGHRNLRRGFNYLHEGESRGNTDLGDSYVEVNLTKQHMFLYIDGEAILDTDVVTGNLRAGHRTPPGIFRVTGKARNRYLVGPDYRTFVSYWMPFNKNIGFHDATWRSSFGGEIYQTAGSHGCVNMPKAKAAELYDYIDKDFLVICYYE